MRPAAVWSGERSAERPRAIVAPVVRAFLAAGPPERVAEGLAAERSAAVTVRAATTRTTGDEAAAAATGTEEAEWGGGERKHGGQRAQERVAQPATRPLSEATARPGGRRGGCGGGGCWDGDSGCCCDCGCSSCCFCCCCCCCCCWSRGCFVGGCFGFCRGGCTCTGTSSMSCGMVATRKRHCCSQTHSGQVPKTGI